MCLIDRMSLKSKTSVFSIIISAGKVCTIIINWKFFFSGSSDITNIALKPCRIFFNYYFKDFGCVFFSIIFVSKSIITVFMGLKFTLLAIFLNSVIGSSRIPLNYPGLKFNFSSKLTKILKFFPKERHLLIKVDSSSSIQYKYVIVYNDGHQIPSRVLYLKNTPD